MTLCRHCNRRKAAQYKRGLCFACYFDPAVRKLYPSISAYAPNCAKPNEGEPTEAELDAIIAEQMRCLPPWWKGEQARVMAGEDD